MKETVIVLRLKTGEDIIGILVGDKSNIIKVEHPYYAKYSINGGNVSMMPYCPLTDESYFEFKKDNIEFIVTAAEIVSIKFLKIVHDVQIAQSQSLYETLEDISDDDINLVTTKCDNTKH